MGQTHDILCIGSVLWDVIGRTDTRMQVGSDVAGRITRLPGGVAMNIAMTLRRFEMVPALLTAIGRDEEGRELLDLCRKMGMVCDHVHLDHELPTDKYMAVEGAGGLIAAIADAHSLEAVGDAILAPLENGTLGDAAAPYQGIIALDGNLTTDLLTDIAGRASFTRADLRVAPASPGKARRLAPLMRHPGTTLYLNLEEAALLCGEDFDTAAEAAEALLARGANRVLITHGNRDAAEGDSGRVNSAPCPQVAVKRITGAGDTFMAAHIAAESRGADKPAALSAALAAAAAYVSGEDP